MLPSPNVFLQVHHDGAWLTPRDNHGKRLTYVMSRALAREFVKAGRNVRLVWIEGGATAWDLHNGAKLTPPPSHVKARPLPVIRLKHTLGRVGKLDKSGKIGSWLGPMMRGAPSL
jgi:hypothetical protein